MSSLRLLVGNLASATSYEEAAKRQEAVLQLGHRAGDRELLAALTEAYPTAISQHARRALLWILELRSVNHATFRQTKEALETQSPP